MDLKSKRILKEMENSYENKINLIKLSIEKMKTNHKDEIINVKKKIRTELDTTHLEICDGMTKNNEEDVRINTLRFENRHKENRIVIDKLRQELLLNEENYCIKLKELTTENESIHTNYKTKIHELQEKHTNIVTSMMSEFDITLEKTIISQDITYTNTINELQKQSKDSLELHQYEMKELQTQYELQSQQLCNTHEDICKQLRERLINSNSNQNDKDRLHHHEIDELKIEYNQNLLIARQQQRDEMKQKIELLNIEYKKNEENSNQYNSDEYNRKLDLEVTKFNIEKENISLKTNNIINELKSEFEQQCISYTDQIKLLKLTHESECTKLNVESESKVSQWKSMNYQLELSIKQSQQQVQDVQIHILIHL